MNRDDAARLLRTRSALTSQPYGDETIDAWLDVLADRTFDEAKTALLVAARTEKRITIAHVIEQLPGRHGRPVVPPPYCEMCDGTGLVSQPPIRAHNPKYCRPTEERPCCCSATEACRCTTGQAMAPVLRRVVEANDRELRRTVPYYDEENRP